MTISRCELLRKCIIVFDALKRVSSKGNAGLEALPGAEDSFRTDTEICDELRKWLREMEAADVQKKLLQDIEELKKDREPKEWQRKIMEEGAPVRLEI